MCAAMASQELEEKVQPHDEDAESSKTGCRRPSRAHGKAYTQVPELIYCRYACRSFARSCHLCGGFCSEGAKCPPQIFGGEI